MVFYPCVKCHKLVRPRQHAVSCDNCGRWQHRTCQTGISLKTYTEAVRCNLDLEFICRPCEEKLPNIDQDAGNIVDADVTQNSTLSSSSTSNERVFGDFTVQASLVESVVTEFTSSESASNAFGDFHLNVSLAPANSTQVDPSDEAELSFDVSSLNQSVNVDRSANQSNTLESDTITQNGAESLNGSFDVNIEYNQTEEIQEQPSLQQLIDYMDRQWMQNPIFDTASWSIYGHTVRTNNDVEGWHHRLNSRAGYQDLTFYRLVPVLRKEAELAIMASRMVVDGVAGRERRPVYKNINEKIENLWNKYSRQEITTSQLLRFCARIYGPSYDNTAEHQENQENQDIVTRL